MKRLLVHVGGFAGQFEDGVDARREASIRSVTHVKGFDPERITHQVERLCLEINGPEREHTVKPACCFIDAPRVERLAERLRIGMTSPSR